MMDRDKEPTPPLDATLSSALPASFPSSDPTKIGRYRVIRLLGKGGFGRVYLAHDDELDRAVAVKVPNIERIAAPEDLESYLVEAKILAKLEHPNIVPVYDAGRADDGLCYVVSKFLQGSDLKERILQGRPRSRNRRCWSPRSPMPCTTRTPRASCTAISSRPTSCSMKGKALRRGFRPRAARRRLRRRLTDGR